MVGHTFTSSATAVAFAGVSMLALIAPFELTQPLIRLPRQSVSNLEAAILLALGSWGVALVWTHALPRWQTPLSAPWMALLAVLLGASLAAPAARVNALHMTGRCAAAFAVYLLTVNGVTTRARLRVVVMFSVVAAVAVSVLACLEYAGTTWVLDALKLFRPGISVVGAQLRAGGPLQYPTIASMYLEVVFALSLGLLLAALDAARPGRLVMLCVAVVLIAEAITLTFTRAGVITMATSLVLVAAIRHRFRGYDAGTALIVALGVIVSVLFLSSRSAESMWLRLTSEGQESWYRRARHLPGRPRIVGRSDPDSAGGRHQHGQARVGFARRDAADALVSLAADRCQLLHHLRRGAHRRSRRRWHLGRRWRCWQA